MELLACLFQRFLALPIADKLDTPHHTTAAYVTDPIVLIETRELLAEVRTDSSCILDHSVLDHRTQESNNEDGEAGIEVIDYGFDEGSLEDPKIVARMEAGPTHNVFPHPHESLLYACNEGPEGGLDIWDVSDPAEPERIRETGPKGDLHDVVIDPERDLDHLAYIGDGLNGYVIWTRATSARLAIRWRASSRPRSTGSGRHTTST